MTERVVCNSSPLIALARIDRLDLLRAVFGEVWIPAAVEREVFDGEARPEWLVLKPLPRGAFVGFPPALGQGEQEAIVLALESRPTLLLLDDLPARRVAARLGLPLMGTLGVLLLAQRRGVVPRVRPLYDALIQSGFRVSERLLQRMLSEGEQGRVQSTSELRNDIRVLTRTIAALAEGQPG